jgi:mRNA-degrading endonuclease RelE of RelBE toxin-antitoxin system
VTIEYTETALADLRKLPLRIADQITRKIDRLNPRMLGDIKRLTAYDYDYRLRAGDHRILFDVVGTKIIIQRILNRQEAYD